MSRVFINPGHGGSDPGAIGHGIREADINAKIGERLHEKLSPYCSTQLVQAQSLSTVTKAANDWKADYIISIHANAHSSASANGIETYHFPNSAKGKSLATTIHKELIRVLGRFDRGVKSANFQVLRDTVAPAALAEIGFISNATEAGLMKTDKWIEDSAEALAIGIANHIGFTYKIAPPAGKNYKVQIGSFAVKANALKTLDAAKAAGFLDAFIVEE